METKYITKYKILFLYVIVYCIKQHLNYEEENALTVLHLKQKVTLLNHNNIDNISVEPNKFQCTIFFIRVNRLFNYVPLQNQKSCSSIANVVPKCIGSPYIQRDMQCSKFRVHLPQSVVFTVCWRATSQSCSSSLEEARKQQLSRLMNSDTAKGRLLSTFSWMLMHWFSRNFLHTKGLALTGKRFRDYCIKYE